MSELQVIATALEGAARRRRWERALGGFWRGLFAGSLLTLLTLGLYKALPLPEWALGHAAVIALAGMAIGFAIGGWRKPDLLEMARWLDDRQQLQERLTTAWELSSTRQDQPWQQLLVRDAAARIKGLDPRQLLPWHLPGICRWTLLVLVLGAGLGFVPEYRSAQYIEKKREAAMIQATARTLAEVTKRQIETRPPILESTMHSLESITNLAGQMSKATTTRGDAVRQLDNAIEKLGKQLKEGTDTPAMKRMESAAREPSGSGESSPGALQRQIDSLQKSLGNSADQMDALQKLKDELRQAKQKADGLPDASTPEGKAARDQLASALGDLGRQARDMGQPLTSLEEAIAALQAGNSDLFLRDLQAAMMDMEKLLSMAKTLQQLQQQATQMGKDLAEQLKNGQAIAAKETLNKMIEQLKTSGLPPDQFAKIAREVKKALGPAGDYGKTADYLARALTQMEKGNKIDASDSLKEASQELQKMLQELSDAQALAAAIESLKHAQMCIANCQGWGECSNPNGKPGFGQGGKPGSGVGTWAEEEGQLFFPKERSGLWDNSGISRPEMDPRGHSERDSSRPENLAPTKIKGNMTPGAPMPSITLKGVSIKGQSTTKYEEAAAAAQTEAKSALNQDQVPRSYRGTVRDYFDDLKK